MRLGSAFSYGSILRRLRDRADLIFTFGAPLWEHPGDAPWVFVTVPREESDVIADSVVSRPGFGSVKVEVQVGQTTWSTSLFPSNEHRAYLLPVKRLVRQREGLEIGDEVAVKLTVVDGPSRPD